MLSLFKPDICMISSWHYHRRFRRICIDQWMAHIRTHASAECQHALPSSFYIFRCYTLECDNDVSVWWLAAFEQSSEWRSPANEKMWYKGGKNSSRTSDFRMLEHKIRWWERLLLAVTNWLDHGCKWRCNLSSLQHVSRWWNELYRLNMSQSTWSRRGINTIKEAHAIARGQLLKSLRERAQKWLQAKVTINKMSRPPR